MPAKTVQAAPQPATPAEATGFVGTAPEAADPTPADPTPVDAILDEFIRAHYNPVVLARVLDLPALQVADVLDHPDVVARLDHFDAVIARTERFRRTHARLASLHALHRVVESEETHPVERRRAATTLLRACQQTRKTTGAENGPRPSPPAPTPTDHVTQALETPSNQEKARRRSPAQPACEPAPPLSSTDVGVLSCASRAPDEAALPTDPDPNPTRRAAPAASLRAVAGSTNARQSPEPPRAASGARRTDPHATPAAAAESARSPPACAAA